ncbi:hypothetical protein [Methylotuvimicrobium buryatense]|uniref:Replication protein n=1 Tax=Methylotuvimicrobium buryatense TaxID=95641 RepID=A0A4V1IJD6_METBY|nr:hypothetical protein [Methylotuvimicrobium buryatense]QCW81035.1 hypothetical protein EQU24_01270 [Methylotuvimicrobium buryatense]
MKTAMAYGLSPDDPAWVILAVNQSGLMAMEKAINELNGVHSREIKAFEDKARLLAEKSMDKAAHEALQKISETLAVNAQNLFRKRELRITTSWLVGAAVIGASFYIGISLLTYQYLESTIYKKALNDAYQIAHDETARANWANTQTGKTAFALSQVTDIAQLAACNKPGAGWVLNKDRTICFPQQDSDGFIHGWAVPKTR